MIAIDENGNIAVDGSGNMYNVTGNDALQQNFISEVRCLQGTFSIAPDFGRNPAVWYLSQSPSDRIQDLIRISKNYLTLTAIQYNPTTKKYEVTV